MSNSQVEFTYSFFFAIMIIGGSMASAIIHICVAKKANELLKRNEKELFLGSIAPDISKQIGETKEKSHFLDDVNNDIPNLDRFLSKYQESLKTNTFNLGYYCHLFADKIWFESFLPNLVNSDKNEVTYINGEKKRLDEGTIAKILYNDYTNLNITMIDEYSLDLSLFYEDYPKIISEINEIPIDKLPIIIDKMGIIIEKSNERKTIVFNQEAICQFIDKTAQEFIENLKEIGVIA